MPSIIYKRLVEVRILNEYYLFDSAQQSIFEMTGAGQQEKFLDDRVFSGQYDVSRDLAIKPTEKCQRKLRNFRIRLIPTKLGFFLGMEVKKVSQPDGSLEYQPFIPVTDELTLQFMVEIRNPLFRNFSGFPNRPTVPAQYYFTNVKSNDTRTFPNLPLPISDFESGKTYEMGALSVINGQIREALLDTTSNSTNIWRSIAGAGYVSENDQILLPKKFTYTFAEAPQAMPLKFVLKSSNGDQIKEIPFDKPDGRKAFQLDFSFLLDGPSSSRNELPDGAYILEVLGNGNLLTSRQVYLSNLLYRRQNLGVVELKINRAAGPYRLLKDQGTLITSLDSDGAKIPHPVFDIKIKSRLTYWRYISNKKKELSVGVNARAYLSKINRVLVANRPRNLSSVPTRFVSNNQNIAPIFLPNPSPSPLRIQDGRVFSDIYVSPIKDLIE